MEHRHGARYPDQRLVSVESVVGRLAATGMLVDISLSGCFIHTVLPASPLIRVVLRFLGEDRRLAHFKPEAHIVRRTDAGIGAEWTEYQSDLLQYLSSLRRAGGVSRSDATLLTAFEHQSA
jgi:PilZ domain